MRLSFFAPPPTPPPTAWWKALVGQTPVPSPPPTSDYAAADAALLVLSLLLAYALLALVRKLPPFGRLRDHVSARLQAEHAKMVEEEDAQARYRFTPGRLERSLPADGVFDAIFIGSGPGSLACAATMAKIGWRCAIFEQGEQLGGGAHVFPERGYEFETGVHYLGDEAEMKGLLSFLTCGRLELAPIGTPVEGEQGGVMYDNVLLKGTGDFKFLAGKHKFLAMLRRRFPSNGKEIDAFEAVYAHHTSSAYKESAAMFFTLKVPWLLNLWCVRWLRTLLQTRVMGRHFFRSSQRSAEEMLTSCGIPIGSDLGAVILGQYGDSGMRPDKLSAMMHLGVMSHYSDGACYPVGGSGQIPRKLNAVVIAGGGRSFTQASVTSLLMAADGQTCVGVTINGGVEVRSKVVVSGIGAQRSYDHLIRPLPSPALASAATDAIARIEGATEHSVAFIFLFLGLDISTQPADERDARSHNTWIYPETDFTSMEKEIEQSAPWSRPMPMFVASGSAKDAKWESTFGKDKKTVVVLSQCPWAWVAPWAHMAHAEREKDASYADFKQRAQAAMMEQGFRVVFPKLEPYIVHATVGTPLTTNNFLGTTLGECYGRSATPSRWLCPDLSPYTPVKNLLLTGQDVVTLGLTGAIASGYLTANVLAGYGCWENILLQREIVTDLGLGKIF